MRIGSLRSASGTNEAFSSTALRAHAKSFGLILLFTALTAAAGQVRVPLPFTPVPLTLQVIPVLLAGAALGGVRGAASQAALLAAGVAGLPVFAAGAFGPAHLLGATGGYLIGFVGAAWFVGRLLEAMGRASFLAVFAVMLSGSLLIHVFGMVHLMVFLGGDMPLAFRLGSLPFLIGDLLKVIVAGSIVMAWPRNAANHDD